MWNRDKSVMLSLIGTRIIMVLGALLACALGYFSFRGYFSFSGSPSLSLADTRILLCVYLAFCIPAYVALFTLDRLLSAIRRDEVFTATNVGSLRLISWCCFAAGFVLLLGCVLVAPVFVIVAVLAAFFGIILRVVKNLFAAAVALKTENDFTI